MDPVVVIALLLGLVIWWVLSRPSKPKQTKQKQTKQTFDLTKMWGWDPARVWVCDIQEKPGESDNDFLFTAEITHDGTSEEAENLREINEMKEDRCIFHNIMYDIQKFTPDTDADGQLDFEIKFGNNTAERQNCPNGWTVKFEGLVSFAKGRYKGTIVTSWWGRRDVILINYPNLTEKERKQYPDMVTDHYFKSR